jgi:ubiquinone/menaquinone biosynthesis C-methylase UbiE
MTTLQTPVAFSGSIPAYYDSYLGPMFFEPFALEMANRISPLTPSHILELASGTGRLTKFLPAVAAPPASIIASDINPSMVRFGSEKAKHKDIHWMEIDAVKLPFKDASFDCVVAQFGVMFYSDKINAFKEALRVLKPGGTFIFNCWDDISHNPMARLTNDALQHFFPIDTPAFYQIPFSYYDETSIREDLASAGFKNCSIDLIKKNGYSSSPSHAVQGLLKGTPVITAIEERDADLLPPLMEYLEKEITAMFGKSAFRVPLQARVVSAVK